MNKRNKKMIKTGLLLLLCVYFMTGYVWAAGEGVSQASIYLSVSQIFEVSRPAEGISDVFTYILAADEENMPLPAGGTDGQYRFSVKGNAQRQIGPITYSHGGVYRYTLSLDMSDMEDQSRHYRLDQSVWEIMVLIRNQEDGGLTAQVVVTNEKGKKAEEVIFRQAYDGGDPEEETPEYPAAPPDNATEETPPGEEQTSSLGTPGMPELTDAQAGLSPGTGDSSRAGLWACAALVSGTAAFILYLKYKKNRG